MKNESTDQLATLTRLSNDQLLLSLEQQFSLERNVSHHILLHLKEIRVRRLYAERGFPNLFSMLVQHFHQSESAANQRLKALDLMMDVPVVEERLVSGDLSLSTVAMAQRQIKREEKLTGKKVSKEKKLEIVESITNKTIAQAEAELFKLLPETASHPQTFERRISKDVTRMNLNFPDDVLNMMNELKAIWAHVDPTMDPVEVIRRSFKIALEKVDYARKTKVKSGRGMNLAGNMKVRLSHEGTVSSTQTLIDGREEQIIAPAKSAQRTTRGLTDSLKHRGTRRPTYYRKELDRALWRRAGCQCEFTDEKTGRRCPSRFGLQREHVIPLALGGRNDLSNMQLLCFTHNQLRARSVFGDKKIDFHQQKKRSQRHENGPN